MNLDVVTGARDRYTASNDDVDHGDEIEFERLVVVLFADDWTVDQITASHEED